MGSKLDDNMDKLYRANPCHYDTGLMRIGCSEKQARAYSAYFRANLRGQYYGKIKRVHDLLLFRPGRHIRILDVGCGLGEDIHALNNLIQNANFVGVEVSPTAVEICRGNALGNMEFLCGTLSRLSLPEAYFDLILNFTVLEHVSSPREVLQECSRLLKEDGILISAVPNHRYWWSWNWPEYTVGKLLGKNIQTHSVKREVMYNIFEELGFRVLDYDVIGFRPPQPFFCHIPENMLSIATAHFEKIGQAWRRTFLRSLLYLEVYVCSKQVYPIREDLAKSVKGDSETNANPSLLFWVAISIPYFGMWWGEVAFSLIRRAFKKVWRRVRGQRPGN